MDESSFLTINYWELIVNFVKSIFEWTIGLVWLFITTAKSAWPILLAIIIIFLLAAAFRRFKKP